MPPDPSPTCATRSLDGWVAWFDAQPIPVCADTAVTIDELAANEDDLDARTIAESIGHDPLMTLRVLAHVGKLPNRARVTDVETVTAAILLMGTTPFFRAFTSLPTVEAHLSEHPQALAGLDALLTRAYRSANFALGFAVHRMDPDAPMIHEAALLHDFAEMLLWCHAPAHALEIARRQAVDPGLRSGTAQREVLGAELLDIQQALMRLWRLPRLLIQLGDDRHSDTSTVRNVTLAVRLARHSARGWDNPALPDDYAELAELLQLGEEPVRNLVRELDA